MATFRYWGLSISLPLLLATAAIAPGAVPPDGLVVIANPATPALNEDLLQKIYLGKVVEIEGRPIIPVNLARGNNTRKDFMERVLAQDEDKFIAYWTVRRYIGKGSPPKEFRSVEEQLQYIRTTPGAVGYVDSNLEVLPGLKTVMKKP